MAISVTANSVSPYIMESTNDAIEGVEEEDINDEANVDEVAYEVLVYNVSEDTNNNTTVSPKVIVTKEDHIEN
ncbi:unnamed protein product [Heterobilharzia americana]|nr:unnamed protein product [Heterobilharzia americana]